MNKEALGRGSRACTAGHNSHAWLVLPIYSLLCLRSGMLVQPRSNLQLCTLPTPPQAEIEALDTVGGAADLPDLLLRCLEQGDCI